DGSRTRRCPGTALSVPDQQTPHSSSHLPSQVALEKHPCGPCTEHRRLPFVGVIVPIPRAAIPSTRRGRSRGSGPLRAETSRSSRNGAPCRGGGTSGGFGETAQVPLRPRQSSTGAAVPDVTSYVP